MTALAWLLALATVPATVSPETPQPATTSPAPASSAPPAVAPETPPAATTSPAPAGSAPPAVAPETRPAATTSPAPASPAPPAVDPQNPGAPAAPTEKTGTIRDTVPWPHYDKGFVLVPTLDPVKVPFRLVFNSVQQFRYTNTLLVESTYTDHFGQVHEVIKRNDIQLTRSVFYFSGFVFTPRLDFNILIYFSSATLSATSAGYVGYVFDRAFALRAGFFSLPSVRSLTGTFPFFQSTDRSMANNFVRPGFTQGVWANGELFPGLSYIAMIGNSLNTLDIAATRIDTRFAYSASVWYDLNDFGKPWNDWEYHDDVALRVGTAFTYAREDRLSDLSTANPENNSIFLSDGTLLFATGALAPGVTVQLANYYLSAADAGLKFRGLAVNFELYNRWLSDFQGDGPVPFGRIYDWGAEASAGYFVLRSQLELYARTSFVIGSFRNSAEGAGGFNWYPFDTRQVSLNAEGIGISHSPYTSAYYVYNVGQTGFLFQSQFLVRF